MGCTNNDNVMLFVGWIIGVVGFTALWVVFGMLCSIYCQKQSVKTWFKYYAGTWVCWVLYMTALLVSMAICIIVGWYVCWNVERNIGYGVLISSQSLNLLFSTTYNIVFSCCYRKKLMEKAEASKAEKGETQMQ